jgi:hypothetical protein
VGGVPASDTKKAALTEINSALGLKTLV